MTLTLETVKQVDLSVFPEEFLDILRRIYSERMSVILVKGIPQTGKTDFALLIAEILKEMGVIDEFATNARINSYDWLKKIESLNILKTWGYSSSKKKLFVYDELIQSVTNRRAMSALNVAWVQNLPQISHQSMHILAIIQQENDRSHKYHESIFEESTYRRGTWFKLAKTVARFTNNKEWSDGFLLTDIPRTSIRFDNETEAVFHLNSSEDSNFSEHPLDIQVAELYAKGLGFRKIQAELNIKTAQEVKRSIQRVLRGSLQVNPVLPKEDDFGEDLKD